MDISTIVISGAKLIGSKFIKDNLGSFNLRELLKKEEDSIRNSGDVITLEKLQLISPFSNFCALPNFEFDKPTENEILTIPFYNAAKKITFDLEYTEDEFMYCKKNYSAINVKDKLELIDFLTNQRNNLQRNNSRYSLGFRSFYFALRQNINKIDYDYVAELNKILTPFYTSYKHKELFIPGLELIEK